MLLVLRLLFAILYCILICIFGSIYCLFSPCNPKHVAFFGRLFGWMSTLFGITVEQRIPQRTTQFNNCIYIANHQNNYDMVTIAKVIPFGCVTIGKKSLLWIPLFGLIYWLTGNLLIDRNNQTRAYNTITQVIKEIKKRKLSFLIFPEGTRSYGRGLLPFKTGAFHAAIAANVPIIPICVSNTHGNINLNHWSNGRVIIEIMPPIDTRYYSRKQVRILTNYCYELMSLKIKQLNKEILA
ncbi:1-acylglycerol-3-phosphate O-acyltransferase [Candidatus Fukatsuia anoeciicola]|uniref:1-acylglycerol-3-phosphate O-acyltransferase n=1 Tax=Candidatus Fukatsuia anoeciicola TaxID=2994492 RepID=UPI003464C15F